MLVTLLDVLRTALSLRGGGALAQAVSEGVWSGLTRAARVAGSRWPLLAAGPVAVVATVLTWGMLAAVGWTLILASSGASVAEMARGAPAGPGWHLVTVAAGGYGLLLLALLVVYLLPVVTAVVQSRQLALAVSYLGPGGDQMVPRAWDGIGFDTLGQQLMALTPLVIRASQNVLAYPVLRLFHQAEPEASLALSLAHLDRALFLLEHGVAEGHRPPRLVIEPLRRAIGSLARPDLDESELPRQALVAPRLQGLLEACIPTVEPDEYQRAAAAEQPRRRRLLALVLDDGWGSHEMTARGPAARGLPPGW